jgi:hypothetical protein
MARQRNIAVLNYPKMCITPGTASALTSQPGGNSSGVWTGTRFIQMTRGGRGHVWVRRRGRRVQSGREPCRGDEGL